MSVLVKQGPISGISPTSEAVVMTVYPSMSSTGLGKKLGELYESIPTRIWGLKISNLIFCPILIPVSLALYFVLKIFGVRYTLTNRSVQSWRSLGNQKVSEVSLNDVTAVQVYQGAGDLFYKAGDIYLVGKGGEHLMVLRGIPSPYIFKGTIEEARDARSMVAASLNQIKSRG